MIRKIVAITVILGMCNITCAFSQVTTYGDDSQKGTMPVYSEGFKMVSLENVKIQIDGTEQHVIVDGELNSEIIKQIEKLLDSLTLTMEQAELLQDMMKLLQFLLKMNRDAKLLELYNKLLKKTSNEKEMDLMKEIKEFERSARLRKRLSNTENIEVSRQVDEIERVMALMIENLEKDQIAKIDLNCNGKLDFADIVICVEIMVEQGVSIGRIIAFLKSLPPQFAYLVQAFLDYASKSNNTGLKTLEITDNQMFNSQAFKIEPYKIPDSQLFTGLYDIIDIDDHPVASHISQFDFNDPIDLNKMLKFYRY